MMCAVDTEDRDRQTEDSGRGVEQTAAAEVKGGPPSPVRSVASLKVCHPALPELVPLFRHWVSDFAAEQGACPELCADVALAVSEAVTNAVKHSDAHEDEAVTMTATASDGW